MDQELIDLITKIWKKYPELRLCQLIGNCFGGNDDHYFVEDADLTKQLKLTYPRVE